MKKTITLIALMASSLIFAQMDTTDKKETETESKSGKISTLYLNGNYSEPGQIGLSYERGKDGQSTIVNLSYGYMNYDAGAVDVDGSGFVIEIGGKHYFSKKVNEGIYSSNSLSYGNINFDKQTAFGKFDGTYSYFSFFVPQVGYKINFGKFSVDPYIGAMWKIEVKGKGDIDNNNTDEWVLRGGVRVGYTF
jgi:hypothetical protein